LHEESDEKLRAFVKANEYQIGVPEARTPNHPNE